MENASAFCLKRPGVLCKTPKRFKLPGVRAYILQNITDGNKIIRPEQVDVSFSPYICDD